ncbi:MAG TPA: hypothetical protein VEW65_03685 [Chryseolinea sp.]|jgi:hypothetical protein|nr:hypothetical protein [Chryseolinea sp.]
MIDNSKTIIQDPPVKVKPSVDDKVLTSIELSVLDDSYVYVHCSFDNMWKEALIRIWKTTFLVDHGSGAKSTLVHAENISIAPLWTVIPDNCIHNFILIFSALPKSCSAFDLIEEIPQPGGFVVKDIQRNARDVYHVTMA